MAIKYITFETDGLDKFVTFDDITNHSSMKPNGAKILGGGFVRAIIEDVPYGTNGEYSSEETRYQCYGKSTTLGIESRYDEDSKILNRYIEG